MNPHLEMKLLRRQNLGDSLRRAAQAAADKPAVIFYGTDGAAQTYSDAQLNALVNTVANNLLRRGIKAPKRIHFRKSLPISAANKILKRDLNAEYADAAKGD